TIRTSLRRVRAGHERLARALIAFSYDVYKFYTITKWDRTMAASSAPANDDATLHTRATTEIVGYRLRRAQLSVFQRFMATFEALNLRPAEYSVLALIADNPGRKQTEIAEILG